MHTTEFDHLKNLPCSIFERLVEDKHEQVIYCYDKTVDLKAIIAIHNTVLGPALGGVRVWDYAHDDEALQDVLRLAKGMTHKTALADIKLGGGKAVIIGNANQIKTPSLLKRYGQFVDTLHGRYVTAPDVNTNIHDMAAIAQGTSHVQSLPKSLGGSDDPSPFTAYGTYLGIKAAAKKVYGIDQLQGKKIGVEGVGKVGTYLIDYLCKEKAQVYVTDIMQERLKATAQTYPVNVKEPQELYDLPLDVYAPCALGATLNDQTIARLHCKIIAGAANNQLQDEQRHGQLLLNRGITYAPDFLINAGGILNVYTHMYYTYSPELVYQHIERIYDTCLEILVKSEKEHIPTTLVAEELAEAKIQDALKENLNR